MKRYAKIISFALLSWTIILSCKSSKESLKLDDECLPIINEFFNKIKAGSYDKAIEDLLQSNSNIDLNDSGTINLRLKFKNINVLSGKYIEYKILKKRGIDSDIAIYSCLVKYQKKFYRYVFVFYKAEREPKIYKFLFDDVIDIELEESLRLYIQ